VYTPNPTVYCGIRQCCEDVALPETLTATIQDQVNCGCADGGTVTLSWVDGTDYWEGTAPFPGQSPCSGTISLRLICPASSNQCSGFVLEAGCGSDGGGGNPDAGCTCKPALMLVFSDIVWMSCCGAQGAEISITITD
jgi:hypothetical protein